MPAAVDILTHDSGDINVMWPQSIFRYVLLYIVDNTGRHHDDFVREGLKHILTSSSCLNLNESFCYNELLWRSTKQSGVQVDQVPDTFRDALVAWYKLQLSSHHSIRTFNENLSIGMINKTPMTFPDTVKG